MPPLSELIRSISCRASSSTGGDGGLWEEKAQNAHLHQRPLLWPAIAALFTASLPSFWLAEYSPWVLPIALILICAACYGYLARYAKNGSVTGKIVLVLFAGVFGLNRGVSWHSELETVRALAFSGKAFESKIIVLETPRPSDFGYTFYGLWQGFAPGNAQALNLEGKKVLVRANHSSTGQTFAFEPGDVLQVAGSLKLPDHQMNPGQFDYQRYLLSKRTLALYDIFSIQKCGDSARPIQKIIGKAMKLACQLKQSVNNCLDRCLPPDDAEIMKAILTTGDKNLDGSIGEDFRKAGLQRFLHLTGFHVDAVTIGAYWLFKRVTGAYKAPRIMAIVLGTFLAWMSGFSAGVIRALVSAGMRLTAPLFCRKYDPVAALCVSALVAAWRVPFPICDMGLQMSFASALGALAGRRYFSSALLGVFLAIVPVSAHYFQDMSIAGFVFGGLWASVTLSVTLLTMAVMALPGGIPILGWLPYMCAKGVRALVTLVSGIPGANVNLGAFSLGEIGFWYAFAGFWAWKHNKGKHTPRVLRAAPFGALAAFLICLSLRLYPIWPEVTFLSVGQGDAAVVRYKNTCIVVDTGTENQFERVVLPFLRFKGVRTVDLCVLSHMHSDHAGGIGALCREFSVEAIVTAPGTFSELSQGLGEAVPAFSDIMEAREKAQWEIGNMILQVVPLEEYAARPFDENERCIACFLTVKQVVFEFWADAPGPQIGKYLRDCGTKPNDTRQTRIVKVPHHGSRDGLLENLYEGASNLVAVISVGPNLYGHPSKEVLMLLESAGAAVCRTDVAGAVTVRTDGEHFKIYKFIADRKFVR